MGFYIMSTRTSLIFLYLASSSFNEASSMDNPADNNTGWIEQSKSKKNKIPVPKNEKPQNNNTLTTKEPVNITSLSNYNKNKFRIKNNQIKITSEQTDDHQNDLNFESYKKNLAARYNNLPCDQPKLEKAFLYFKKISENGKSNKTATYSYLGLMNLHGWGTTQDENQAFKCFKKAAELQDHDSSFLSNQEAKNNLAVMYLNGWGVEKNLNAAFTLFTSVNKKAYVSGEYFALAEPNYYLGLMYFELFWSKKNQNTSLSYFENAKAAPSQHPNDKNNLVLMCDSYINRINANEWGNVRAVPASSFRLSEDQNEKYDEELQLAQDNDLGCYMCFDSLFIKDKSTDQLKVSSSPELSIWDKYMLTLNNTEDSLDDTENSLISDEEDFFCIESDPDDHELLAFGRLVFPNQKHRKPNLISDEEKAKAIENYRLNKMIKLLFPEEHLGQSVQEQEQNRKDIVLNKFIQNRINDLRVPLIISERKK